MKEIHKPGMKINWRISITVIVFAINFKWSTRNDKCTFIRACSKIGNKMKTGSTGVAEYRRPSEQKQLARDKISKHTQRRRLLLQLKWIGENKYLYSIKHINNNHVDCIINYIELTKMCLYFPKTRKWGPLSSFDWWH